MRRCRLFSLANLTVGGAFVCRRLNNKSLVQLRRSGMKLTTLTVAFAAVTVFAQSAQAHEHRYGHRGYHHVARRHIGSAREADASYAPQGFGFSAPQYDAQPQRTSARGLGGRPAAWCGWEMRQLVGSDPGASFNLARNWAHWGPSRPGRAG